MRACLAACRQGPQALLKIADVGVAGKWLDLDVHTKSIIQCIASDMQDQSSQALVCVQHDRYHIAAGQPVIWQCYIQKQQWHIYWNFGRSRAPISPESHAFHWFNHHATII